ncbi:MAG: hypothetical protein ACPL89_14840, partial [Roseiflexus castenholzii]
PLPVFAVIARPAQPVEAIPPPLPVFAVIARPAQPVEAISSLRPDATNYLCTSGMVIPISARCRA